jgi:serine/threonine protein kinase
LARLSQPTNEPSNCSHNYTSHSTPGAAPETEEVGPFVLGPVLGQGCTGIVRLGTHKVTGFKVAFKIMKKKYINSKQNLWSKVRFSSFSHNSSRRPILLYMRRQNL